MRYEQIRLAEERMFTVRQATLKDAEVAVQVVRQSIEQLCTADHRNDPATLTRWLTNKTPEHFHSWIASPDNFCVVAEMDGRLSGVGLLQRGGEIQLFYLAPGTQHRSMGRAIHAALETQAHAWGLRELHLDSTAMARSFYEALGYQATGAPVVRFGVLRCYPYGKTLQPFQ